jgi:hypothetical protein
VVNRGFIYSSLAQSEQIILVQTATYSGSDWYRKEAWFADVLTANGLAHTERITLPAAMDRIAEKGNASHRQRSGRNFRYGTANVSRQLIWPCSRLPQHYSSRSSSSIRACCQR